ncbi:hypothetical protein A0256_05855 [Mucilaginibacter sp. PAMC 26640]|nr:hypothetical protein A0256_05855 [Mucilaginibacter sp. PAMC 26640]
MLFGYDEQALFVQFFLRIVFLNRLPQIKHQSIIKTKFYSISFAEISRLINERQARLQVEQF